MFLFRRTHCYRYYSINFSLLQIDFVQYTYVMRKRFLAPGEEIENFSTWQLFKNIFKLVLPYRGRFIIGTLFGLICETSGLYSTYALAAIITIFSKGNVIANAHQIWIIMILWAISLIIKTAGRHGSKFLIYRLAQKIKIDVELSTIQHMFKLDIGWHERENTGNKLQRIHSASSGYTQLINIWINNIIPIAVDFVGTILIVMHFSRPIAIVIAIFMIIYLLVAKMLRGKVAMASHMVNVRSENVTGLQYEAVANVRTVKIMSMIRTIYETLEFRSSQLYEAIKNNIFWIQNRTSSETFVSHTFKISVLSYILYGAIQGRFEVGLLIIFNNYFNNVWQSVEQLSNVSQDVLIARYSISRLKEIMEEPVTIDDETEKLPFPANWKVIALKNISFAYGENVVLKNISFEIKRGEKIGVIGLSGAGKSTLFKLLLKEYESFEGEILIDGVPIQKISKEDYFKYVAVVLQETEVFNFSLRENIYLAGPGTENKEVELNRALEIAHVTDFIPKLPQGVDTPIGEKGVKLSGGEKQRLGIARAVFKQPQMLLMDEATSHLDLESEEKIQDSLHKFFHSVTAVVIAHRLTTIKEMDKILVIEDGEVIESGNFAELTAKQGRFYELWEKQRL